MRSGRDVYKTTALIIVSSAFQSCEVGLKHGEQIAVTVRAPNFNIGPVLTLSNSLRYLGIHIWFETKSAISSEIWMQCTNPKNRSGRIRRPLCWVRRFFLFRWRKSSFSSYKPTLPPRYIIYSASPSCTSRFFLAPRRMDEWFDTLVQPPSSQSPRPLLRKSGKEGLQPILLSFSHGFLLFLPFSGTSTSNFMPLPVIRCGSSGGLHLRTLQNCHFPLLCFR